MVSHARRLAMIDAAPPESLWPPLPLQPLHCRRCTTSSPREECSRAPASLTSSAGAAGDGAGGGAQRSKSNHLIVEAGTGTGKTLAYLLPALRTGQRVIISTGTKNLQEQLFFSDVPFLESLLGPLRVCYMKGRANYLCRHKLLRLARSADPERTGRDRPVPADRRLGEDHHRPATGWRSTRCRRPARCGPSSMRAARPAWAKPVPIMNAASSPRCGARRSKAMSSSSTIISFLPIWPSSSRPRRLPMRACCRKLRR